MFMDLVEPEFRQGTVRIPVCFMMSWAWMPGYDLAGAGIIGGIFHSNVWLLILGLYLRY